MRNMATSLFDHERIITTRARGKVLRSYAERIITRARKNLHEDIPASRALHNKREVMRHIRDRDIVKKLFEDIAPRFKDRPGGYTRIIHLPDRRSDSAPMSIVELVDRRERQPRELPPAKKKRGRKKTDDGGSDAKDTTARDRTKKDSQDRDDRQGKWYDRFRRRKRDRD